MKTKNTRVRVKDIKQGVVVYKSHPVYGIQKLEILGKPFVNPMTGSLFAKAVIAYDTWSNEDTFSLCDSGISSGSGYNFKRSFFKLKHAEEWARKMKTDPEFIDNYKNHVEACKSLEWDCL